MEQNVKKNLQKRDGHVKCKVQSVKCKVESGTYFRQNFQLTEATVTPNFSTGQDHNDVIIMTLRTVILKDDNDPKELTWWSN